MINILHIIDKLSMDGINPSSCTVLMGDWYANMDLGKFRMTVCTLRSPDPAGSYLENMGIKVHYLGHGKISPANITSISKLIESEQADIVHLHGYSAANFGRIASRRMGVPNIVHEHAVLKVQLHQYIADKLLARLTDEAIAVSGYVRDFMIEKRSIPAEKIHLIENGIQLEKFNAVDRATTILKREELGIDESTKIIGTVTRLREEKGNEYLIRAIHHLMDSGEAFVLLIAGDGPLREKLEKLAKDLQIQDVVRFLGFRTDIPELSSAFDIQVIPSLTEGFPLCLAEAMAAKNAVVATYVGGMKDIGREGDTVLFSPPEDSEALAEKILYLLKDERLAKKMAESAEIYSKVFDIRNGVKLLEKEYERLYNLVH